MKLSIACEEILLQGALELFLKEHLSLEPDFFISDKEELSFSKPSFILGKDLAIPFTKAELLHALHSFEAANNLSQSKTTFELKAFVVDEVNKGFSPKELAQKPALPGIEQQIDAILKDAKERIMELFLAKN